MKLLEKPKVLSHKSFKVYFDNNFTSLNLLDKLSSLGTRVTSGIIRDDRLANYPLPKKRNIQEKEKWTYDFAATLKLFVMKYRENNVVTVALNFDSTRIGTTRRYIVDKKAFFTISLPTAVHNYNLQMGGVDRMDQWVASYRTRTRQKNGDGQFLSIFLM